MKRIAVAALTIFAASSAVADQQAANTCAAGLDAELKVIYDDVAPQVTPTTNLRDVVTSATRSLVIAGKVSRATAKPSAEAAGACLEKLKS